MALQTVYKQFLSAPNISLLASDASLHYVTTLVTLHGSSGIIKQLHSQSKDLKIKEQEVLDVVEAHNAIAVEVRTTIEFLTGGGSYLPGLDDNFLADRSVTFPIIHIVTFDVDGKICQIRMNWDQGSLLKLIDVIGKTGRNWPIRDGKDQIKLIESSVKSSRKTPNGSAAQADENAEFVRSRCNSTNVTRDPHASLELFVPRHETASDSHPSVVPPRASARPAPRDYHDLFVGGDSNGSAMPLKTPAAAHEYPEPPSKSATAKGGAGKNYHPSRLFDMDAEQVISPERKTAGTKFKHFNFEDLSQGPDENEGPVKSLKKSSNHGSQWNFEDFQTPQKVIPTKVLRTNDVRHWGNSNDEPAGSPIRSKKLDKPRRDAEPHFEFQDDGTPEEGRRIVGRPRGQIHNDGLSLYKNLLFDEQNGGKVDGDDCSTIPSLANVKDRRKDFDPHFIMTDSSPGMKPAGKIPEDRAKVVKMMDANWAAYDHSPSQKENVPASPNTLRTHLGRPLAEATNTMSNRNDVARGIKTDGDGMGGKKGTGRSWGFGDESDGEEEGGANRPGKYRTGKQAGKAQAAGGDFWDF